VFVYQGFEFVLYAKAEWEDVKKTRMSLKRDELTETLLRNQGFYLSDEAASYEEGM
jgi:hypothetical protein